MECRDVLVLKGTGVWFQILSSRDSWASLSTQTMLFSGAQLSPAVACAADNQSMLRGSEMIIHDEKPMGHYCREVATITFKTGFVDVKCHHFPFSRKMQNSECDSVMSNISSVCVKVLIFFI